MASYRVIQISLIPNLPIPTHGITMIHWPYKEVAESLQIQNFDYWNLSIVLL